MKCFAVLCVQPTREKHNTGKYTVGLHKQTYMQETYIRVAETWGWWNTFPKMAGYANRHLEFAFKILLA